MKEGIINEAELTALGTTGKAFQVLLNDVSSLKSQLSQMTIADRFMTADQAASYLTLSKSALLVHLDDWSIPHKRLGSRIVFDKNELDAWMQTR